MISDSQLDVILTVGNSMMGDDGAGPLLAELMQQNPLSGWQVIDGGTMPEDCLHQIRTISPKRVVIFDAADLGLAPGEVRFVDKKNIANLLIMNTHAMPLTFLIESLEEIAQTVVFLGIQPDIVAFYYPMTDAVKKAVEMVYAGLSNDLNSISWLE